MPTPAPCCRKALSDATLRWPDRNRASDGIMGDPAHQARKSDHNEGNAFDLTNDPAHGVDCDELAQHVIHDGRVTYVIWNRRIYNRARAAEGWRAYTGPNAHSHHMHVSIRPDARDDLSPWPWSPQGAMVAPAGPAGAIPPYPGTPLREGSRGPDVGTLQRRLRSLGCDIVADGIFGARTHQAVAGFQTQHQLTPDGVVGPLTWATLWRG
jgi:hypothetical protein